MKTSVFRNGSSQCIRIPSDLRLPAFITEADLEPTEEGFLIIKPIAPDPDEGREAQERVSNNLTQATELLSRWAALPEAERLAAARKVQQAVYRIANEERVRSKPSRRTDPAKFPFHGFPSGRAK